MLSFWVYILVGNDRTGKTIFQKRLIYHLTGKKFIKLARNTSIKVSSPNAPNKMINLFTINRSYQESKKEYKSIENYFKRFFKEEDVCILSSHSNKSCINDIQKMIQECRKRFYNVGGVFFSNKINDDVRKIALLDWDERYYLNNPELNVEKDIKIQIDKISQEFAELIIRRSYLQ